MLTRELGIAEYDFAAGRVRPDRLTQKAHAQYRQYAMRMLATYKLGIGRTRRELHQTVRAIFSNEADCPARRIDAFCKLLDDRSEFAHDTQGKAAALRREVFHLAAARHPLVRQADRLFESEEQAVKAAIAKRLGRTWDDIDAELFSDIIDFHRLQKFPDFASPEALLARYNVAQVQVALFDAVSLTVWATTDFKAIVRYAKLARLMHTIVRSGERAYCLRFDGPASVLRETRRYGAAFARFLPALIACSGWRLHAVLRTRRSRSSLSLDLTEQDGLHSHVPAPDEFDSSLEESFATKWGDVPRDGWQLIREGEVLHQGQKVFIPDFIFEHTSGRRVALEIVGFWTPEYLEAKRKTLAAFADHPILLAVAEKVDVELPALTGETIVFKTVLKVKDVAERLARLV